MKLHTKLIVPLIVLIVAGITATAALATLPSNTTPPAIRGTAEKGMTLTATNGAWTGNPTFQYRWQRCAADGTGCVNIPDAKAKAYTLTSEDVDHAVRIRVTATNGSGSATAFSNTSDLVSDNKAPTNTVRPTVSGAPKPGEEFTATKGTWTGGVRSNAYQWQRCDTAGAGCVEITGATGSTYGVRTADVGHTLRVVVSATNLAGSNTAASDVTAVVASTTAPAAKPTTTNRRPSVAILGVRFVGARVYVRFRACDDSYRNVGIRERDSKPRVASYVRNFRTLSAPRPCAALTRSWMPAPRFRHGRFTIRLTARDAFGLTSLRTASRTFFR